MFGTFGRTALGQPHCALIKYEVVITTFMRRPHDDRGCEEMFWWSMTCRPDQFRSLYVGPSVSPSGGAMIGVPGTLRAGDVSGCQPKVRGRPRLSNRVNAIF